MIEFLYQTIMISVASTLLLCMLYIIYRRYSQTISFLECNDIEFKSCVLSSLKLSEETKTCLKTLYNLNTPSFFDVLMSRKPLLRKHYYSQELLQLFFTPYENRKTNKTN